MSEKRLVGNVFIDDESIFGRSNPYGVGVSVRNSQGQGWGFDISNVRPDDLRYLADHLDKILVEKGIDPLDITHD